MPNSPPRRSSRAPLCSLRNLKDGPIPARADPVVALADLRPGRNLDRLEARYPRMPARSAERAQHARLRPPRSLHRAAGGAVERRAAAPRQRARSRGAGPRLPRLLRSRGLEQQLGLSRRARHAGRSAPRRFSPLRVHLEKRALCRAHPGKICHRALFPRHLRRQGRVFEPQQNRSAGALTRATINRPHARLDGGRPQL